MAVTGHRSVSEVSRYTKARDQALLAEQAMAKLSAQRDDENKARQNLVQPPSPVGQNRR